MTEGLSESVRAEPAMLQQLLLSPLQLVCHAAQLMSTNQRSCGLQNIIDNTKLVGPGPIITKPNRTLACL